MNYKALLLGAALTTNAFAQDTPDCHGENGLWEAFYSTIAMKNQQLVLATETYHQGNLTVARDILANAIDLGETATRVGEQIYDSCLPEGTYSRQVRENELNVIINNNAYATRLNKSKLRELEDLIERQSVETDAPSI